MSDEFGDWLIQTKTLIVNVFICVSQSPNKSDRHYYHMSLSKEADNALLCVKSKMH